MTFQQPTCGGRGGSRRVQVLLDMWLPVGVISDAQPRQPGSVIIHDVAGAVSWPHNLQGAQQRPI